MSPWGCVGGYKTWYDTRHKAVSTHPTNSHRIDWTRGTCRRNEDKDIPVIGLGIHNDGCAYDSRSWPDWVHGPGLELDAEQSSTDTSGGAAPWVELTLRSAGVECEGSRGPLPIGERRNYCPSPVGSATANGVVLTAALPAGTDWSVDPAQPGCSIVDGVLRCEFEDLPAEDNRVVRLVGQTTALSCGESEITAQATSSDAWESPVSTTTTVSVTCRPAPELSMSAVVSGDACPGVVNEPLLVEEGTAVEYCYTAINSGDGDLLAATVTDDAGTPGDPSDDITVPLDGLIDGALPAAVTATAGSDPFTVDVGTWTRQATLEGTDETGTPYTATAQAVIEASDVAPTIDVSVVASTDLATAPEEVTYTVAVENTSVEAVTLTTIDDLVHGVRRVDLSDPPADVITTSSCALDTVIPAGETYQCTFTRTLESVGVATDLVLAVVVDNETNRAEAFDVATVTVEEPAVLDLEIWGSVDHTASFSSHDLDQWRRPLVDQFGLRGLKVATAPDAPAHFELRLSRLWITGLVQGAVSFDDPTGGQSVEAFVLGVQEVAPDGTASIHALWIDPRMPARAGGMHLTITAS